MTEKATPSEIAAAKLKIAIANQRGRPVDPEITKIANAEPLSKRVLGRLEGGPAHGMVIELDGPHWAPLGSITIQLGEGATKHVYVLARQPRPAPGKAWRYVPTGSPQAATLDLGVEDTGSRGEQRPGMEES